MMSLSAWGAMMVMEVSCWLVAWCCQLLSREGGGRRSGLVCVGWRGGLKRVSECLERLWVLEALWWVS